MQLAKNSGRGNGHELRGIVGVVRISSISIGILASSGTTWPQNKQLSTFFDVSTILSSEIMR